MSGDRLITPAEALELLRGVYRSDGEIDLKEIVRKAASDPIKPISENGRMRPRTSMIVSGAMIFLLIAAFFYFSFGARP